jgi:hypothetical protein
MARVCQGCKLHRVGTRTKVDRWKAMIDYPNPDTCVWRSVVVSRRIYRMVWVKCTTSAECKPIRIAESSVMDGWNGRYLAQCRFCFQRWFRKNGERCRTEYTEGTVVARLWFRVLVGYYRGNGGGHVWLTTGSSLENEFPLFLELLLKMFYKDYSLIRI